MRRDNLHAVAAACRTLDVEPDASDADIRKSFRRLSLQWHPDKNAGSDNEAAVAAAQHEAREL